MLFGNHNDDMVIIGWACSFIAFVLIVGMSVTVVAVARGWYPGKRY